MKTALTILGTISLLLGVLGIALPILPTTPFLLLSATLFAHSSPRLYNWLLAHKRLGPYIRDYRERKALPNRFKIISISILWITILISIVTIDAHHTYIKALLLLIAVAVTWHIASLGNSSKGNTK